MRYQTAPRPEASRRRLSGATYVGSSYAEAGDRTRTGSGSLEGSNATNYTSPARRPIIGSSVEDPGQSPRRLRNSAAAGRFYWQGRPPSDALTHAAAPQAKIDAYSRAGHARRGARAARDRRRNSA